MSLTDRIRMGRYETDRKEGYGWVDMRLTGRIRMGRCEIDRKDTDA